MSILNIFLDTDSVVLVSSEPTGFFLLLDPSHLILLVQDQRPSKQPTVGEGGHRRAMSMSVVTFLTIEVAEHTCMKPDRKPLHPERLWVMTTVQEGPLVIRCTACYDHGQTLLTQFCNHTLSSQLEPSPGRNNEPKKSGGKNSNVPPFYILQLLKQQQQKIPHQN